MVRICPNLTIKTIWPGTKLRIKNTGCIFLFELPLLLKLGKKWLLQLKVVFCFGYGLSLREILFSKTDLTVCRSARTTKSNFFYESSTSDTPIRTPISSGTDCWQCMQTECGCNSQGSWGFYVFLCFDLFSRHLCDFLMSYEAHLCFHMPDVFHYLFLSGSVRSLSFVCVLCWRIQGFKELTFTCLWYKIRTSGPGLKPKFLHKFAFSQETFLICHEEERPRYYS